MILIRQPEPSDLLAQLSEFILVFWTECLTLGLASTRLTLGDNSTCGRYGRQYDRIENVRKGQLFGDLCHNGNRFFRLMRALEKLTLQRKVAKGSLHLRQKTIAATRWLRRLSNQE